MKVAFLCVLYLYHLTAFLQYIYLYCWKNIGFPLCYSLWSYMMKSYLPCKAGTLWCLPALQPFWNFLPAHLARQPLTLCCWWQQSPKAQERKNLWKLSKPCLVGIHWIALAEYSHMSTHLPGFQWFFRIFVSANLVISSIRVKVDLWNPIFTN